MQRRVHTWLLSVSEIETQSSATMENGNGFKRWGFQKKQQDVKKAAIL
ncbi:hypothetical protein SLA2020_156910, partial [Shorea laevis]